MANSENIRFATYNVSLNRTAEGELITDLSTPDNEQAKNVAEVIQRNNPDIVLLNEFDFDAEGTAIELFQENYLGVSQNGVAPVEYPYVYLAPSNTGIPSGLDFDNDGSTDGAGDAFGFGFYPGQFAMVLLSKYPIVEEDVRTFQNFIWQDMPGALLPDDLTTPEPQDFYSPEELEAFRLSSKSHWDIPIEVNGEVIHVLASHPTPPVFDGEEDRNGRRNHDEIRFWSDYVTPGEGDYIYDDAGNFGSLAEGENFIIAGDQNADPFDGDSTDDAILQLLDNPLINTSVTPDSEGGVAAAVRQNEVNDIHEGNPGFDTADFNDETSGNLRVDYVLPSQDLTISEAGVFWTTEEDELFRLIGDFDPDSENFNGFPASDHRLVYTDVNLESPDMSVETLTDIEFIGEVAFETGLIFEETEVGGLSGLTFDETNNIFYAISDDQSTINDARYYDLAIDLSDGSLDDGDVEFKAVTTLLNAAGDPFSTASLDTESITLTNDGTLFISSEGDSDNLVDPFVNEFTLDGQVFNELAIPEIFLPTVDQSSGIQDNLAFESLTITPDGKQLFTATESALFQDGEIATLEAGSPVRIIQYDLETEETIAEFLYEIDPIPVAPDPVDAFADNGLVELLAIDNQGTFLALERSFAVGVGNNIRLYEASIKGATDISGVDSLLDENGEPIEVDAIVDKELILDFSDLGITLDNSEAVSFGEVLPDGRQSIIVASDNNFSDSQITQFLAFAIDTETIPTVTPVVETPDEIRFSDPENPDPDTAPDADDPAIYIDPDNPEDSLVIGTFKNDGLRVYDLAGEELESITPEDIRYNNVDIAYGVEFPSQLVGETASVDLAIASNRANDTLAILAIDPNVAGSSELPGGGILTDVTSVDIPESIFGVDDGEATAYGLATYTSLVDGKNYVFVSQADGNKIAQLELLPSLGAADELTVDAEVVRTFEVPIPEGGELPDAQVEGMVVDRETGVLYLGQEEFGIWKVGAEPNSPNDLTLVDTVEQGNISADVEGLTIYYGEDGNGYLIASSQGDNTLAIYDRAVGNSFLASFAVDEVEESDGADVTNLPLGDKYPAGLLVVQDGSNEPQVVFPDPEDGEIQNFNTNFKFVSLADFSDTFASLPPYDPTAFDPREPEAKTLINGVASGDTTQDSTVLWTRSNVLGNVTFEYATDAEFNTIVGTVNAEVTDTTIPVKVKLTDLEPGTDYFYRVTDAAGDTDVGQFVTPGEIGTYNGLRFGATGDWQQAPPYPSLVNVADSDLDLFVKLGDTIYADIETPALPGVTQATELSEFRIKQGEVLTDRLGLNTVPELYASTSILATIDDHEIVDNFAGGAAPGESPDAPDIGSSDEPIFTDEVEFVNDTQVYEDALQAFQEYHPLKEKFYGETGDDRTANERQLYRFNTYGSDAAFAILDSRSFRDDQLEPVDLSDPEDTARFLGEAFDPSRTLLGRVQVEDLKADLLEADAAGVTWKFVTIPEPIQNFGVINAEDRFEGYAAERNEILKFIDDNNIDNVVFMAGDFHGTIVNNLTYQTAPGGEQIPTNAFEIVTGPVAFNDGLFGPTVVDLSAAAGVITPEEAALFESLPVASDTDSEIDDRDDFVQNLLVTQTDLFGFDPVGLSNNLAVAEGEIDAELIQGDYVAVNTFGWTEFDIDAETQQLKVTTFGIEPYSEAELLADPNDIINRTPQIVSEFVVNPQLDEESDSEFTSVFGTLDADTLEITGTNNLVFAGEGNDTINISGGENRLDGDGGDDIFFLGTGDVVSGGAGADQFWVADTELQTEANHFVDFELGTDVIGFSNLGIGFEDLTLTQDGDRTLITVGEQNVAILNGVAAEILTSDNFAFV
ncbi:MAG: phytase [Cyanobacteria bacterium P01_A01_bin.40]